MYDDMDLTEGAETRTFSIDNVTYEIDLNDTNYRKLKMALRPFIDSARRQAVKGKPRKEPTKVEPPKIPMGDSKPTTLSKEQNDAIRDWARKRGHKVSSRGRIPSDIINEFHTDHAPDEPSFSSA
jgi:hypothetical protein